MHERKTSWSFPLTGIHDNSYLCECHGKPLTRTRMEAVAECAYAVLRRQPCHGWPWKNENITGDWPNTSKIEVHDDKFDTRFSPHVFECKQPRMRFDHQTKAYYLKSKRDILFFISLEFCEVPRILSCNINIQRLMRKHNTKTLQVLPGRDKLVGGWLIITNHCVCDGEQRSEVQSWEGKNEWAYKQLVREEKENTTSLI